MEYIKEQTIRLVNDVLLGDFALSLEDIQITFSGGRGYHVHVRDKRMLDLPSGARRELADYLTTSGINEKLILNDEGFINRKYGEKKKIYQERYTLPETDAPGWKGLVSRKIHNYIDKVNNSSGKKWENWQKLLRIKEENAKRIINKNNPRETFNFLRPHLKTLLVRKALSEISVLPDEPVTGDLHRLIRLPGSLHGGSGLKVVELELNELEKFDPVRDASAFGEKPVKIRSIVNHPVSMGNIAKLMPNSVAEVPEKAAIYFMARKWAHLVLET